MYHYIYRIDFLHPNHFGKYYIGKRTVDTYRKTIIELNNSKEDNAKREAYWIGNLWKTDPLCMNQEPGGLNGGIKCYSLDGNLVKVYYNRQELKEDGYNPKCVDNVLAGRAKTHRNHLFKN